MTDKQNFEVNARFEYGAYLTPKAKDKGINNITDKQIIIDGVDVSGCEHLTEKQGCWLSTCDYLKYKGNITNKLCKYNPNCYYKQLKRKEQECEELKEKVKKYGEINEQETKDYAELKAENEELKKIINEAKNSKLDLKSFLVGEAIQNEYEQQLDQLKQTLAEIKEIAEKRNYLDYNECLDDILQKISEC